MEGRPAKCLLLLCLFAPMPLAARCTAAKPQSANGDHSRQIDDKSVAVDQLPNTPHTPVEPAPLTPTPSANRGSTPPTTGTAAEKPPSEEPARKFDGPAYTFRLTFRPGETLYYVIENNFRDRGGVPPLLSFTTFADDKRTVIQTLGQSAPFGPNPPTVDEVAVQWEFDRYEARERGMKDEVRYDSLRDLYPRAELRELGSIPGARSHFIINVRNGETRDRKIEHRQHGGPPTRRRLSRTSMRCALNDENLATLLDDLGQLYLPPRPVHVGESWTVVRPEEIKSFGRSELHYRFTLEHVAPVEDRQIASIRVEGDYRLVRTDQPDKTPPPTSRPGVTSRPARQPEKPREFQIDHALCRGSIEFDLTRGELISMDLTRELDISAAMESEEMPNLRLETGSAHRLRVRTSHTAPPKPIIAGGPKPPADDPPEPGLQTPQKRPPVRQRPPQNDPKSVIRQLPGLASRDAAGPAGTTTQPSNGVAPPFGPMVGPPYPAVTSRPAHTATPTSRPALPSSRPTAAVRGRPTVPSTQPAGE